MEVDERRLDPPAPGPARRRSRLSRAIRDAKGATATRTRRRAASTGYAPDRGA